MTMKLNHIILLMALLLTGGLRLSGFVVTRLQRSSPAGQSKHRRLCLEPCHFPGVEGEPRGGPYEVFEGRGAKAARKTTLKLVVIPALTARPAPGSLLAVTGGPGP